MLGPGAVDAERGDLCRSKGLVREVRLQRDREGAGVGALDVEGAGVLLHLDVHAPVPRVAEAGLALGRGHVERVRQRLRQRRAELLDGERGAVDGEPRVQADRELGTGLECPVLDQLGVKTTVARVIDVLDAVLVEGTQRDRTPKQ